MSDSFDHKQGPVLVKAEVSGLAGSAYIEPGRGAASGASLAFAYELADAAVVEKRRHPVGGDEYGGSTAHDKGFRVVDLNAVAVDQGDRERAERRLPLERPQRSFKLSRFHRRTSRVPVLHSAKTILCRWGSMEQIELPQTGPSARRPRDAGFSAQSTIVGLAPLVDRLIARLVLSRPSSR